MIDKLNRCRRKPKISFVCVFILTWFFAAASPALARDDWQNWNNVDLTAKLADQWKFKVGGQQRLRDDFSDAFLYNVTAGFSWQPVQYLELGPYFKYEREKRTNGDHVNENRYYWEATLKHKVFDLSLSSRNRMEYRNKNARGDGWRYRNQFKASYRLPFVEKIKVAPFVSEEIFWDITGHELNQNRFASGISFGLNKHVSLSLYYMLKSNRSGLDWDEVHVLGTGLSLTV